MIRCQPLSFNEFVVFGTMVEEKREPGRTALINVVQRIQLAYDQYINNFDSLQLTAGSSLAKHETEARTALNLCYSSATVTFQYVRGKIFEVQPPQLKAFCPYCLLNSPDTLDHYIGQSEFPEYSVLSKNLIPCCYDCNRKKGELWRKDKLRRIIHFYNDSFFTHQFLRAKLKYSRGSSVPTIVFFLKKPAGMNDSDFRIAKLHFKDLSLLARYEIRANTLVSSEHAVWSENRQKGRSVLTIIEELNNRSRTEAFKSGVNYWMSILYATLANSRRFIKSL